MTWSPNPQICVNDIDLTGITINSIQITGGRNSVDDQPRPAYTTISLFAGDTAIDGLELNTCLMVEINNSAGTQVTLFKGFITDIARQVVAAGTTGFSVQYQITAVSALARLAGLPAGTSYAKQFDGDRVYAVLGDSLLTTWEEVDPALTWATIDPALTWDTFDPNGQYVGTIDRPGSYELTAYTGDPVNAASFLDQVAKSAYGTLYEKPDGTLNYAASEARLTAAEAGFIEIPADIIASGGLGVATHLGDIINEITVTYKNDQATTSTDSVSVDTYGRRAGQRSTYLENLGDAENQAGFFIETRAHPREFIQSINVVIHADTIVDATRDALIGAYCGVPIRVTGIPTAIYAGGLAGFIEGYVWQITANTALVNLTISDYQLSALPQTWAQVSGTLTWENVDPALTWATAVYVGE